MDETTENPRSSNGVPPWAWVMLGAVVATIVFLGYGQAELLLQAANLRFCS